MSSLGLGLGLHKGSFIKGFVPSDISGLGLWFDANDIDTITKDGSNFVSQWNDKSSNAYNVTQGVGVNQPLYVSSGFGNASKPYISFNGTSQFLSRTIANIFSGDSSGTMFFVYTRADRTTGSAILLASADTASTGRFINFAQTVTAYNLTSNQANASTADTIIYDTTAQNSNNQQMLGMVQSTGTEYIGRVNGVAQNITVSSGSNNGDWFADTSARDNLAFGAFIRTTTIYSSIYLAEVVYYSAVLTAAQILQVEAYFTSKYGTF